MFPWYLDECHILNLCVDSQHQRQGLGRQLMQYLFQCAKAHSIKHYYLEVRESNDIAMTLYQQLGFTQTGFRKAYYPADEGRENAIIMTLEV